VGGEASVDGEGDAVDEPAGGGADGREDGRSDLVGVAESADWDVSHDLGGDVGMVAMS
jgi:hypothetical protein